MGEANAQFEEKFKSAVGHTEKRNLFEEINLEARHWLIIGIVLAPILLLFLLMIGFNKKAKPVKRRPVKT